MSLTAAALVLSVTESTINAVVFAGLAVAVGVVIDDAVIAVQNTRWRLSQRREGSGGPAALVREAAAEMLSPMGFATLVVLLVLLPVFFMSGVSGSFFEPVARSYALAVLASMLVTLTVTPALCMMLLSNAPPQRRESPLTRWAGPRYGAALSRIITRPRAVAAAVVVAALAGLAVIPALDGPFIPSFKDRDFLVHLDGPPGTSRVEMSRVMARASRDLRAVPGVTDVAGHAGRAVTGDQVVDINSSELWVKVASDADYDATKASIKNVLEDYAGARSLRADLREAEDPGRWRLGRQAGCGRCKPELRPGCADGNRPSTARRARLRREPRNPAAAGDTDEAAALAESTASSTRGWSQRPASQRWPSG